MKTEEEALAYARKYITGLSYSGLYSSVNAVFISEDNAIHIDKGGCHGQLQPLTNPQVLANQLVVRKEDLDRFHRWWNWITDPEKSPWKILFQNGIELVVRDEIPLGWILSQKTLRSTPFRFQKNFCIATRSFGESWYRWVLWDQLVQDYKMDPVDAYYFTSVFTDSNATELRNTSRKTTTIVKSDVRTGGHWALTDLDRGSDGNYDYGYRAVVNWGVLRSGKIDPDVNSPQKVVPNTTINSYFMYPLSPEYKPWSPKTEDLKDITKQGRFSTKEVLLLSKAVDNFYKWQEQEGILRD